MKPTRLITALLSAPLLLATGAVLGAQRSTAAMVHVAEFVAPCPYSHRAMDDPIVHPGMPGMSHSHDFFGSRVTGAGTRLDDLRRGSTTCRPREDRSAYWVPTLYDGSHPLRADRATFYYVTDNARPGSVRPYPLGLRIVAGYAKGRPPGAPKVAEWACSNTGLPASEFILACPAGTRLELHLRFPDCWDGRHLDSPDHASHMAYSSGHRCPHSHPVAVPELKFKLRYPTRGGAAVRLSSGDGGTLHGDFFNAWRRRALAQRIDRCLHAAVKCGVNGLPQHS